MGAIFGVETIDRATGEARVVRVEARSADAAREQVLALGEVVGAVTLLEVRQDQAASTAPAGAIANTCPKCGGVEWSGGRGLGIWLAVILLFPLGLLALLIQPTWRCGRCGFTFQAYTPPAGMRRGASRGYGVGRGVALIFVAFLLVYVAVLIALRLMTS